MSAALAGVIAVACLWSSPPSVDVHVRVLLTECAGTEPKNPPPGWSPCSTHPAGDATVILAPMIGPVVGGRTDAGGIFTADVAPGTYIVAARGTKPVWFASQPSWVEIPPRPSIHLDIGATFAAA